jgi:YHS domain-containing protein
MLRIPDAAQAVQLGLRITHELLQGHGAPAVRVGLHHGPAIERDGDYFGTTVNLAARVAAVATGGEVLLTSHTAALAPALEGIFYQPRGRQTLRNIGEPVELFAAIPQTQPAQGKLPIDPVCQMAVDPEHAAGWLIFEDTAYFFCTIYALHDDHVRALLSEAVSHTEHLRLGLAARPAEQAAMAGPAPRQRCSLRPRASGSGTRSCPTTPFGAAASPDLTILPVFLAATTAGVATAVGSLMIFGAVTIATIIGLALAATRAGYEIRGQWLERWGNIFTALVLVAIGLLVLTGTI